MNVKTKKVYFRFVILPDMDRLLRRGHPRLPSVQVPERLRHSSRGFNPPHEMSGYPWGASCAGHGDRSWIQSVAEPLLHLGDIRRDQ
jgi:hypothetical protein